MNGPIFSTSCQGISMPNQMPSGTIAITNSAAALAPTKRPPR